MATKAQKIRRIGFTTNRIIKRTRDATTKALDQVMNEITAEIRKSISIQAPLRSPPKKRKGQKKPNKPRQVGSTPPNPPHRRTGFLHDNTTAGRKGREFFIRTPKYGIYLEGGTSKMAARPFILPVIHGKDQRLKWTKRINDLIRTFSKT